MRALPSVSPAAWSGPPVPPPPPPPSSPCPGTGPGPLCSRELHCPRQMGHRPTHVWLSSRAVSSGMLAVMHNVRHSLQKTCPGLQPAATGSEYATMQDGPGRVPIGSRPRRCRWSALGPGPGGRPVVVQEGELRRAERRLGLGVEGAPAQAVPQNGADLVSCPNRHDVGRVTRKLRSGACLCRAVCFPQCPIVVSLEYRRNACPARARLPQNLETGLAPLQLAQASLRGSLTAGDRLLLLERERFNERERPVSHLSVDGEGG